MKYLRGEDHLVHLSSNGEKERRGLIREINSIPASDKFGVPKVKGSFHIRANSVQPSRNQVAPRTTDGKWLNEQSGGTIALRSARGSPNPAETFQVQRSPVSTHRAIGMVRFSSPLAHELENVHDDPIRYIKKRAGDKKEEVKQFIDNAREMLIHNIGIMHKKHEIIKL